jgi:MoxR-like ATPase
MSGGVVTMPAIEYSLGGKTVYLKEPYKPPEGAEESFVGRHEELRLILTSWIARPGKPAFAPVLVGKPGVGKTQLAYAAARLAERDLYVFNGSYDIPGQDLAASFTTGDDSESSDIRYLLSALSTAMVCGGVFLCDELGELHDTALAMLLPLLDDQQCIESTLLGHRIKADPRFRFIATMNSNDPLIGRLRSNDKLARRLDLIEVGDCNARDLQILIECHFPAVGSNSEMLTHFWRSWRRQHDDALPTPSEVFRIFRKAENLAEAERISETGCWACLETAGVPFSIEHLNAAFEQSAALGQRQ